MTGSSLLIYIGLMVVVWQLMGINDRLRDIADAIKDTKEPSA